MHTAVWVCGMLRCAKVRYCTCTRHTRFGNTAGLPAPVLNPSHPPQLTTSPIPWFAMVLDKPHVQNVDDKPHVSVLQNPECVDEQQVSVPSELIGANLPM